MRTTRRGVKSADLGRGQAERGGDGTSWQIWAEKEDLGADNNKRWNKFDRQSHQKWNRHCCQIPTTIWSHLLGDHQSTMVEVTQQATIGGFLFVAQLIKEGKKVHLLRIRSKGKNKKNKKNERRNYLFIFLPTQQEVSPQFWCDFGLSFQIAGPRQ